MLANSTLALADVVYDIGENPSEIAPESVAADIGQGGTNRNASGAGLFGRRRLGFLGALDGCDRQIVEDLVENEEID